MKSQTITDKDNGIEILRCKLVGIRPIMFDRYPGDNNTKLEPLDKTYLNEQGNCCVPVLAIFSLLAAQNTPSVAKRFWGKQGRDVATGIMAFTNIIATGGDPMNAEIRDEEGRPYPKNDDRIKVVFHVARMNKGIPNPKQRPFIPTGWSIDLEFELAQNNFVSVPTLKKMVEQGGTLGLGTFRPIFGRYRVEWTN